jgi:hypothetical protein
MDQIFFKFRTLLCLDLEEVLSQDPRDITIVSFSDSINSLGEIDLNRTPRKWK